MMSNATGHRPPETTLRFVLQLPALLRQVDGQLRHWGAVADTIADPELRTQARASLQNKRFHCEGGGVYALATAGGSQAAVRFIVAFQTISDYLDNLCDRSPSGGGPDLRCLHRSMTDAVTASSPAKDYYQLHPHREDSGYLRQLVAACQRETAALDPERRAIFAEAAGELVSRYNRLQEAKHLPEGREEAVQALSADLAPLDPELLWWEMAAACGSTLGIFALFAAAAGPGPFSRANAQAITRAYFPWIAALHILLDYWIDQAEDRQGGDLNFAAYYRGPAEAGARLRMVQRRAWERARGLEHLRFHRLVVSGLPALYLADPKVGRQGLTRVAWNVMRAAGPPCWTFYWAVHLWRAVGLVGPTATG